ncbi:MAG: DUF4136 domain-containing protein [Gammaproteobacteria bacterium]|nr:DUF4136 domain-containing protein [Gammaproteobacteria bacterium]
MNKSIFLFTIGLVISACTLTPKDDIQVTSDIDPKINFSGYKTYEWLGSLGMFNDPAGKWKAVDFDMDSEIAILIDRELGKRGIEESMADADLLVMYLAGIDMEALQAKTDPQTQLKTIQNVPQGGLVIALIDARSGFVIWVGTATAQIRNLPSEQVQQRLDYAVTQMIKQIPKSK